MTTEAPKPWKESILHVRGLGLARLKDHLFQETPEPCHLFLAVDFPLRHFQFINHGLSFCLDC